MKVKIGPYRERWVSYVHDRYMNKKYDRNFWPETQTRFENFLEKTEDVLQWIYNHTINLILDRRDNQKICVRIDRWDTWSMDDTLAPIILPMLKQLKETKHGSPIVDNVDVPEEFRAPEDWYENHSTMGEVDPKHHERWDWVLDEMVWAFEQKCRDDWQDDYYVPYIKVDDDKPLSGAYEKGLLEDLKAHQERMSNGFRLFGKYYENLWD